MYTNKTVYMKYQMYDFCIERKFACIYMTLSWYLLSANIPGINVLQFMNGWEFIVNMINENYQFLDYFVYFDDWWINLLSYLHTNILAWPTLFVH